MNFINIALAREVASELLQEQKAMARIEARKMIVSSAVEITHEALNQLAQAGIISNFKSYKSAYNNKTRPS